MLEAGQGLDDPSIQTIIEHAMFGMLIPQAWSLGNKGVTPFIMNSNKPCSAKNPFPKYMSNQVGEETYVCVDNTLYYLLSATGKSHDCIIGIGAESCTNNEFSTPPGLTSLDGKAYGGVTKDELVNGYVAVIQRVMSYLPEKILTSCAGLSQALILMDKKMDGRQRTPAMVTHSLPFTILGSKHLESLTFLCVLSMLLGQTGKMQITLQICHSSPVTQYHQSVEYIIKALYAG